MKRYVKGSLVLSAALLSACGGGGTGAGNIQAAAGLASIDSRSAPVIAAAVSEAVVGSQNLATIGEFSLPGTPTGFASASAGAPQILAATFGPETVECAAGGNLAMAGALAVPQSLTVGDSLVFEFSACDDGDGVVTSGRLEFEIVSFSGDIAMGRITLTVSMVLESFEFFDNGLGGSMSGNLSFTVDTTNLPESFVGISSAEFSVSTGNESLTLQDYILTMTVDPMLGTIVLDSSAAVATAQLSGSASYVTTESLVFGDDGQPASGQILVTGAGAATLTINILSAELVELEIDTDGNDTVDEVIVTSWAELIG